MNGALSCFCAASPADWDSLDAVVAPDCVFYGIHPWFADSVAPDEAAEALAARLAARPDAGVGEIGLDRLKSRVTGPAQNALFARQLAVAAKFGRPVVLHGAKCWGETAKACGQFAGKIPSFLFHGFSRSDGLLPDIVRLNGFVSVGPAVLNDHAVNYRALVKKIPADRILAETDSSDPALDRAAMLAAIAGKIAELRGVAVDETSAALDANFRRFVSALKQKEQT